MISYLRPWLEKEYLGPGFVSMSPLSSAMRKTSQISSSKFHVISKYATLQIYDLIINTLSLFFFFFFFFFVGFFFDVKAKSQKKNWNENKSKLFSKTELTIYRFIWRCEYWATDWTIKNRLEIFHKILLSLHAN